MVYSLGLPLYARLSTVIADSQWSWPAIRSIDVEEIILLTALIPHGEGTDTAQWLPSKNDFLC